MPSVLRADLNQKLLSHTARIGSHLDGVRQVLRPVLRMTVLFTPAVSRELKNSQVHALAQIVGCDAFQSGSANTQVLQAWQAPTGHVICAHRVQIVSGHHRFARQ